jgi:hypothetical protein
MKLKSIFVGFLKIYNQSMIGTWQYIERSKIDNSYLKLFLVWCIFNEIQGNIFSGTASAIRLAIID